MTDEILTVLHNAQIRANFTGHAMAVIEVDGELRIVPREKADREILEVVQPARGAA